LEREKRLNYDLREEKSNWWKGGSASIKAMHAWVKKWKGKTIFFVKNVELL